MNRTFCLFVLILCWAPLSLATPYGEWGLMGWEDSEGIPMNEAEPGMVMPEKGDVGFPAYPGAKVMSVVPIREDICSITLRASEAVSSVCDFYEEKFKTADGYTIRSRDDEFCHYSTDEVNHIGILVSMTPDPVYSSKNGEIQIGIDFHPKNNYSCYLDE